MSTSHRAAIIGLGIMGRRMLDNMLFHAEFEPVALWDPSEEACAKAAEACKAEGVDIARLALRFCLDHPYVSSTLVGMSTTSQLESNLAALDFEPPPALLRKVRSILEPYSGAAWPSGLPENQDAQVRY